MAPLLHLVDDILQLLLPLADVTAARDELVQKVQLKVQELPRVVYDAGKSREQEENVDGAGEYYLRYLSCTTENGSSERQHAKEFLAEKFNMRPAGEAR